MEITKEHMKHTLGGLLIASLIPLLMGLMMNLNQNPELAHHTFWSMFTRAYWIEFCVIFWIGIGVLLAASIGWCFGNPISKW